VCKIPGFESFMRPKSLKMLQASAVNGPVVILNTTCSSCAALIVTSKHIECVPLLTVNAPMAVNLLRSIIESSLDKFLADLAACTESSQSRRSTLEAQILWLRTNDYPVLKTDDVFRILLELLWTDIVSPVFSALGLKV
jgi:hypothetical protein